MKSLYWWERVGFTFWPPFIGLRDHLCRLRGRWRFWGEYRDYCRLAAGGEMPDKRYFSPWLYDATATTPVDPSYYFQDAWGFEKIFKAQPSQHVDVGSHHKFVSLLSKVVDTTMVDLRPLPVTLDSLKFKAGTILSLPFPDASLPSVSSLCVIEHIGLGRYGDPLDPEGSVKAMAELKRIVRPGGDLYISVPLDDVNRIYFNAHRAFCESYLEKLFAPFEIVERRYIFGNDFTDRLRPGFGTGCYHLRRPLTTQS
jgi:SAM-dependent methyltransferase